MNSLLSFPAGGMAVVVGATGGIGAALFGQLQQSNRFAMTVGLSRHIEPCLDITSASSVETAARNVVGCGLPLRIVMVTTGILHAEDLLPEKSWRELDALKLARSFAVNTIGPAVVMKNFLPLLPQDGKSVFAVLSARVGSIGDNRLGGWYSYRASKAALNQIIRTAAIELARSRPHAICVALHPGTVATPLSAPFAKSQPEVQAPELSASRLLTVLESLDRHDTGKFYDHLGKAVEW